MSRRAVLSRLAACSLLVSCNAPAQQDALATFDSRGREYTFATSPNNQGPDTPCVTLAFDVPGGRRAAITCATDDAEAKELATAFEFEDAVFVIGYGLESGESIVEPGALRILVPADAERGYFVVQFPRGVLDPSLTVQSVDGAKREIPITRPS